MNSDDHPVKKSRAAGLSAAAAAGGVTAALAQAANGAALHTNLVLNPGFESVDTGTNSGYGYGDVLVNGWLTTTSGGSVFAYNYAQNYDNRDGNNVPLGNDFSSSTDYFLGMWLGNYQVSPESEMNAVQSISLVGGDAESLIVGGSAMYDVSGYFTVFSTETGRAQLTLEFFDDDPATGNLIEPAVSFADPDGSQWSKVGDKGMIPSDAKFARITLEHDPNSTILAPGLDAYADNISFQVIPEPSGVFLGLLGGMILALIRRRRS